MDERQLEILQHTLGLDEFGIPTAKNGISHRNYYVAGGDDVAVCRTLVQQGDMLERKATELTGGSPLFQVTEQGKQTIAEHSPKPPKLTRGQQRYQDFLDTDGCCGSFGDFLKSGMGNR